MIVRPGRLRSRTAASTISRRRSLISKTSEDDDEDSYGSFANAPLNPDREAHLICDGAIARNSPRQNNLTFEAIGEIHLCPQLAGRGFWHRLLHGCHQVLPFLDARMARL